MSFFAIIEYLVEEWSPSVAEDFIETVEHKLELLAEFPLLGVESQKKKGMRKLLLSPQNMLVYRIERNRIILLQIYDTRQNPMRVEV
ncbi:MAG: type II toxin-antitoxin system RelE/ParE family toxin [Ignavibacteriales bacterium]|nr:type II toxin-antitoxin system RelE/ParE family toxin [Ignavibacteriales bacterium]